MLHPALQHKSQLTSPPCCMQEAAGTVTLNIRYNWLRGTADGGRRTHIDLLTVAPRKSTGARNIVSHLSNVNHWMMSHDNVWCALDKNHPAVTLARKQSKQRRLQAGGTDNSSIDGMADVRRLPLSRARAPFWQWSSSCKARKEESTSRRKTDPSLSSAAHTATTNQGSAIPMHSTACAHTRTQHRVHMQDVTSPTARTVAESDDIPAWQKRVRSRMDQEYGDDVEGGIDDPASMMFEYSVADALQKREDESQETGRLKAEARCGGSRCDLHVMGCVASGGTLWLRRGVSAFSADQSYLTSLLAQCVGCAALAKCARVFTRVRCKL